MAVRPQTLTLAVVPVLVGSALAWRDGATIDWWVFLATLFSALCIQAGTNLFNDASDGEHGADGADRIGPVRVTGAGLATAGQVRRSAWLLFALAFSSGITLVFVGGWPILAIGIAALLAGWAYSGGPLPLSHTAWGEVFVIAFFGVSAVAGSYFLQRGQFSALLPAVGVALGLQAAAVLLLNNLRDHVVDQRAGRRTLVQVTGVRPAYWLYGGMMLAPFPLLALLLSPVEVGLAWLALPFCLWLVWRCSHLSASPAMNVQLGLTATAQVLFGALLAISLSLDEDYLMFSQAATW
jgi:1,4-dihydroxy-2-naphthoate octaprenyltransferase